MQTVRTDDGTRYLLLKQSSDTALVRDPATGDEQYIETDRIERTAPSSLATVADAVPESVRHVVCAVSNDRALGLLLVLDRCGPMPAAELMERTDLCERDITALLSDVRAAGLVETVSIGGVPGYDTTDRASEGLSMLCEH